MKVYVEDNETGEQLLIEEVDWRELQPHGTHTYVGKAIWEENAWRVVHDDEPDPLRVPTPAAAVFRK